jgi:excisionase family DNA binding protein
MRSLEEWQAYVEQQIEAAKKRRTGGQEASKELPKGESASPVASEQAAAREKASVRTAVARPTRMPASDQRLPEGRALLSWEDTSPLQKSADTPPPSAPLPPISERLASSEEASAFAERLGLAEPQNPRAGADEDKTVAPSAAPSPSVAPEPKVVPLKPYQPRDPRWQSSVAPERLRVNPVAPPQDLIEPSPAPPPAEAAPKAEESPDRVAIVATEPMLGVGEAEVTIAEVATGGPKETDPTPRSPSKRAKRLTAKRAEAAVTPPESPEQIRALWDRVPRHVQALIRTQDDEVAQRSYKNFRESREDLVYRLLDPELSLEEAARILAVCPTTVRRYTNRGLLSHHRTPGNQRRFRLSHVLEFMERYGQTLEIDARREREAGLSDGETDGPARREEGEAEGSISSTLPS